ncbi:MAG: hypothetical protein V2A62_03930 [Candidatus Woesearchaeota archaeon]
MQVDITEKKQNPFLKRTEVKGKVTFEGATPSNVQLGEAIAKEMKAKEVECVVVKQIHTAFSLREANFVAFVYDTVDARKKTEKLTTQERKKIAEAKKAAGEKKEGEQ